MSLPLYIRRLDLPKWRKQAGLYREHWDLTQITVLPDILTVLHLSCVEKLNDKRHKNVISWCLRLQLYSALRSSIYYRKYTPSSSAITKLLWRQKEFANCMWNVNCKNVNRIKIKHFKNISIQRVSYLQCPIMRDYRTFFIFDLQRLILFYKWEITCKLVEGIIWYFKILRINNKQLPLDESTNLLTKYVSYCIPNYVIENIVTETEGVLLILEISNCRFQSV